MSKKAITVNETEAEVIDYLKNKLNIEFNSKFQEQKLDGEAILLLQLIDIKPEELGLKDENDLYTIIDNLDNDFLKLKVNINQDDIFLQVANEDMSNIWQLLDNKFNSLKIGEKLKYIKYLFFRDPPPDINKIEELNSYLKKVLKMENYSINQQVIKNILNYKKDILDKYLYKILKIDDDLESFKIKMIVQLINQGIIKKEEEQKTMINEAKIKDNEDRR